MERALRKGELTKAHNEALAASRYYAQYDPKLAWKFRILDASASSFGGRSEEVLLVLHPQLPISLGDTDISIRKRTLEALAYARLHRYNDSQNAINEALASCNHSNSPLFGDVFKTEGLLAIEKGQYEQAYLFFLKSLSFAQEHKDGFLEAWALLDLSQASLLRNHFDEAIFWAHKAYESAKALDAQLVMEGASGNLGWAYYEVGDVERPQTLFLDAYRRAKELGSQIDEVRWLTASGYLYLTQQNSEVAKDSYRQALTISRQLNSKEDIFNALISLAFVTVQTGQLDQAKQYSDEALSMARADGNRTDELYALLAQAQVAAKTHNLPAAEQTFREIAADPKVDLSLRWEAQHELANLYEEQRRTANADKTFRASLTTFETARDQLQHEDSKLPFLNNSAELYNDYVRFLIEHKKPDEALRIADFSRGQTLAEGLGMLNKHSSFSPAPLNAQQIARRLHSTILFYWLGPKQSYLWVITPQRTSLLSLLPEAEINSLVQRYRKALAGPRDPLEIAGDDGIQLYNTLIAPAQKLIFSGSDRSSGPSSDRSSNRNPGSNPNRTSSPDSRVIVIPDGSLNNLNFETLIAPQPKPHYWIEDVTLSDASSLRMLSSPEHASKHTQLARLLLIGDPVAPNTEYMELPQAATEMHDIEQHFASSQEQIFTRAKATPAAYMESNTAQFSYIHFVAHGTASRVSPLDSAVVLSKSSADENSFKLYARDIITHPLHADLVTISTCYGAGARAYTGEGLVGLSWAFLRAGAHNVIGALWEVSDSSTPQLMDELYRGLQQGHSPQDALRAAKLSLLHSEGVYRKPFYWAPFQLYTGR